MTTNKVKHALVPKLRFKEFEGEWEKKPLSKLATKITDGTHDTPKQVINGVPFLTAIHIKDGFVDYKNCYYLDEEVHKSIYKRCNPEKGDLLIVNIGAGTATCAINIVDYEFSLKNVALIKPNKSLLDGTFLSQIQRRKTSKIFNQLTSGGAQPFLSLREIGKLEISIPSLPEQQKIASFLSAVDEKIQLLTRKKELLEHYKKGAMQQLFSQKLRFKDANGNDYADWEEKTLLQVASFRRGSFPQPYGLPEWYDDNGAPFVQVYDVADNMLLKPKTKQYISEAAQKQSVFVKRGSLVLTIQGSIGRLAKTQYDAFVDRTLLIFQSFKVNIDIDYFKYVVYLLFEIEKTKAPGGTIKTITKEQLSDFNVNIPILEEQQKIASFLSAIDEKIEAVNQQISQCQTFKKGLLQQLFV